MKHLDSIKREIPFDKWDQEAAKMLFPMLVVIRTYERSPLAHPGDQICLTGLSQLEQYANGTIKTKPEHGEQMERLAEACDQWTGRRQKNRARVRCHPIPPKSHES